MWSKNFDSWNVLKKQLDERERTGHFGAREVWWCYVGVNIGREQGGHDEGFERPVLVIKGFGTDLFWGVLLSTKIKPSNRYYLPLKHDGIMFSAIISQLRLMDTRRLIRKMYVLEPTGFKEIQLRLIQELANIKSDPPMEGPRVPKEL